MILRFRCDDRPVVDYDRGNLLKSEAIALQKVSGRTIADIDQGVARGDAEARSLLYWLVCRRADADTPSWSEFDFNYAHLAIEVVDEQAGEAVDPTQPADAPPPPPKKK